VKSPPDPLERAASGAQDWLFLCPDGTLANAIAKIGEYGLDAHIWSDRTYRRVVRGRKIVLVTGESGPDFDAATDRITKARGAGAAMVRHWPIIGLGVAWDTSDEWLATNDIANLYWLDKPWKAASTDAAAGPAASSRNGPAAGTAMPPDDPPIVLPQWPAPPGADAFSGPAGDIVRTVDPESEADPVALLVQLLIAYGNAIGRRAHVAVGAARHHGNEFAVLVGETSAGRKGTSWSDARQPVAGADPEWSSTRILGGLSSGEGLIHAVRDQLEGQVPVRERGRIVDYQTAIIDPGVSDKRLLVFESGFGGVLKALGRDGNKLSAVIRQAWDGDSLATLTKGSPFRSTGAHISMVAHITADELTRLLTLCDQANGFANRMLWVCCRRSKLLPYGGRLAQQDADRLQAKVAVAITFARDVHAVDWTRGAMDLWEAAYPRLTAPRPGVFGMVTSRAEAHTVRLALLYALEDCSSRIEPAHLQAALALWDYCERSARYIFGDALGDKDAQAILDALRAAPAGLTRTEISRGVFNGHKGADTIASRLGMLLQRGLVRSETAGTDGRPAERWLAVANCERSALSAESHPAADPSCASFASSSLRNEENADHGREVFEL
jgi:hypothetical protein